MSNYIINIEQDFESDRKAIKLVEPMIRSVKDTIPIRIEKYYNILIAVTEAVNNAIIHGNRCDIDKKVFMTVKASIDNLLVTVKDEGLGFDLDNLADPRNPENLLKENGRGVFLIKEFSDKCKIKPSSKGTLVSMTFKLN